MKMEGKKPYVAVVIVHTIYTGMFLLSKAALSGGLNPFVFVFYRQALATIFLAPITFFLEWKTKPALSTMTFLKIFMLSLLGITLSLDINMVALGQTTATLAAATTNTLPVITFFLAVLFRMENVKLKTIAGVLKVTGIIFCLGGAAAIAFLKGPYLRLLVHHHLFKSHVPQVQGNNASSNSSWTKGVFLMLLSNVLWGSWLVLQGLVLKSYPSKLLSTTLQCFLSTIQSFIIAIALVRDPNEWKLGWNLRLLSVAYCGIVVTGVTFYIQAWIIEKRGPVFLAVTTPLILVFTICSSAVLLGEIISFGSVLGGLLLVLGLYCVLWGKTKEQNDGEKKTFPSSTNTDVETQKAISAPKEENLQPGSNPKALSCV
ncbi:OLC1v1008827C2 [Oldenlandia corymbosa var. corymbosa]|uniref:WAT1-related protein n=1 Tax=Oldenlandia corymbosa var. corymbosa TaxID=529605 RepID=A0AAV1DMF4_OLDCO|nr:OLC1v1008827C2 [Oldenlandia corymbosa var. corymbosa]